MLRISKLTDYATVILAEPRRRQPRELQTAAEVAERTRLGLPTVSKLLKSLQRAGLVASARGAHGGYQLARPAGAISAAEIIDALEGPVAITECSGDAQPLRHRGDLPRRPRAGSGSTGRSGARWTTSRLAELARPRSPPSRAPDLPRARAARARDARRAAERGRHVHQQPRISKRSSAGSTGTASSPTSSPTRSPPGLDEDVIRAHLGQEGRARSSCSTGA